jgi:acyl carrier protein
MTKDELVKGILAVLAEIRAVPIDEITSEVDAAGMEAVMVTSLEVVAILVTLESATGVDPADPDVLKGCNLQSLQQLTEFVTTTASQ